jgi:hypothetical protein
MDVLVHLAGYLVSVMAVAGIVVGIEALNERCPHAPFRHAARIPVPIKSRTDAQRLGLRRPRP